MSAYLVDNDTINRIVTYIDREVNTSNYPYLFTLAKPYDIDLASPAWQTSLATAMLELNERSLHERYGDMLTFRVVPFEHRTAEHVQVFKSLNCFLCQCCEGDCDQMSLYRFLDDVKDTLAVDIVRELPAYDKAEWA